MKILPSTKLALLWGTVFLFAICNAVGWFWLHNKTYDEEYLKSKNEVQMANRAFVEHTEQIINQADTLLQAVRGYYLQSDSVRQSEDFIKGLGFDKKFIGDVYIIDSQGSIVIPTDERNSIISSKNRDYFLFHSSTPEDKIYISPVGLGQITKKEQFRVSRRINRPDGSFGGVVMTPIEPKAFANYYRRLLPNSDNAAVLVGTLDKKMRARSPDPSSDLWQKPINTELWDFFAKSPSGAYRGISGVDGIERQFIYDRVSNLPLVIVTGFSDKDVEHSVAEKMPVMTLAATSATLIVVLLAAILTVIEFQRQTMQKLATMDALTGIFNRRYLISIGNHEFARARRYKTPLSLMMLDIDHFKVINDTWGHPVGDRVLQAMACVMTSTVRSQDVVGRLGGEEFLIILPETDTIKNKMIAERIRSLIEECSSAHADDGSRIHFKVSVGIVTLTPEDPSFDSFLSRVDKALYRAKETGRNRVVEG
ncbi:MAG: sensor domain-containing diguanylate cyclase [Burkholderiaceae bacterium]|nr:sensor domain-containing diguanylate cyclase [Burkholderiaceae bacterium]